METVPGEAARARAKRFGEHVDGKIEGDEAIAPGGCLITGESGLIDATIETQFAEVETDTFRREQWLGDSSRKRWRPLTAQDTFVLKGRVDRVVGLTAQLSDFPAPVGAVCRVETGQAAGIEGEIVGFRAQKADRDAVRRNARPQGRRLGPLHRRQRRPSR